jgi:hypothetical protein
MASDHTIQGVPFLWDSQNALSFFKAIMAAIIFLYCQLLVLSYINQVLNGGPFSSNRKNGNNCQTHGSIVSVQSE